MRGPCSSRHKRARLSARLCERTTRTGQGACPTTQSETPPPAPSLSGPVPASHDNQTHPQFFGERDDLVGRWSLLP